VWVDPMKKSLLSTLAALAAGLLASPAFAAEMRDVGDVPLDRLIVPQAASAGVADAQVAPALARALGLDGSSSLRLLASRDLPRKRGRSLRFSQLYRGVPIWDQQVVVRQGSDGRLIDASGTAVFGLAAAAATPPAAALDADAALRIAIDSVVPKVRKRDSVIENPTSELVYRMDERGDMQLVYKVSFFTTVFGPTDSWPTRPVIFVDAASGRIVDSFENLQHIRDDYLTNSKHAGTGPGGNEKAGRYRYGGDIFPKFLVTEKDGECLMDGDEYLQTEDLAGTAVATDTPFSFDCFNNPGIAVNGGYSPMNDAQGMGEVVWDLYYSWYGVAPLGRRKLLLRVRYADDDGDVDNAFWNGVAMTFGNGKNVFYPPVSLDVTGHEVSHGFTEFNSGLVYFGEAGGINEAYSDMAGVATEAFFADRYGQPFSYKIPNFDIGQEVWKGPGQALRYMCDPPRDGHSIDHASDFVPGMDPHRSSGVYNKAFCLLAKSEGWNIRKAFEIFLVANESYWVPRTNYVSGAIDVMRAAALVGNVPTDPIAAAFEKVGVLTPVLKVGEAKRAFTGKRGGPFEPKTVNLRLSSKVPVRWDVSGVPDWLKISETSGVVRGKTILKLAVRPSAAKKLKESQSAVLTFHNDSQTGQAPIRRRVELVIDKKGKQRLESSAVDTEAAAAVAE
jgi:Zn-dependent metalloprotease